jgi:hypothetical protein
LQRIGVADHTWLIRILRKLRWQQQQLRIACHFETQWTTVGSQKQKSNDKLSAWSRSRLNWVKHFVVLFDKAIGIELAKERI